MSPTTVVFLLTSSPSISAQWRNVLGQCPEFQISGEAIDAKRFAPTITLTDNVSQWNEFVAAHSKSDVRECGVIVLGDSSNEVVDALASLHLPADSTDRELVLACRLFAENVRLRREQLRGDHDRTRLHRIAMSDPLTGLANRRAWDEEFSRRVQESRDTGRPLCLALFDLDNFKQVNETLGYAGGDDVLRLAGNALANNVRGGDFVARYGGDEFAVLIGDAYPDDAQTIVERLRRALVNALAEREAPAVTASVGCASFNQVVSEQTPSETETLFFSSADQALRRAKLEGRNRSLSICPS